VCTLDTTLRINQLTLRCAASFSRLFLIVNIIWFQSTALIVARPHLRSPLHERGVLSQWFQKYNAITYCSDSII